MRVLAVKLRAIGDTVIWTSALRAFQKKFPQAELHIMTYESNMPVFDAWPSPVVRHSLKSKSPLEVFLKFLRLRRYNFDLFLGFHASPSVCRWATLTRSKKYAIHNHSWTFTPKSSVPVPHAGDLEDAISRDYRVFEALGFHLEKENTFIAVTPQEKEAAAKELGGGSKPKFIFLPGAAQNLRRYPLDLWLPLVKKVKEENKFYPVVICDKRLSEEWGLHDKCRQLGVPLFDDGDLRKFICRISAGQVALANDSGPGHIAVALGLRTHFVFGPGCVGDWHPYDKNIHPLSWIEVPCRHAGPRDRPRFQFCGVESCDHHSCMRKLNVELSF